MHFRARNSSELSEDLQRCATLCGMWIAALQLKIEWRGKTFLLLERSLCPVNLICLKYLKCAGTKLTLLLLDLVKRDICRPVVRVFIVDAIHLTAFRENLLMRIWNDELCSVCQLISHPAVSSLIASAIRPKSISTHFWLF